MTTEQFIRTLQARARDDPHWFASRIAAMNMVLIDCDDLSFEEKAARRARPDAVRVADFLNIIEDVGRNYPRTIEDRGEHVLAELVKPWTPGTMADAWVGPFGPIGPNR